MKKTLVLLAMVALMLCMVTISSCKKDDDEPITYTVTITNDGNGVAEATIDGIAITQAQVGTTVTVTANPNEGYAFTRWVVEGGNISLYNEEANPATFTMPTEAVTLKAEFSLNNGRYTITVTDNDCGTAEATIDGIAINQVQAGAAVTLTATPDEDYIFTRWIIEGGDVILSNEEANPASFTMPAEAVELKAEFEKLSILTKITDPAFKMWCEYAMENEYTYSLSGIDIVHPAWDTNGDGLLLRSEAEAVKAIIVGYIGVTSLTGVEYFKNLEVLDCYGNTLTSLDVSKNTQLKVLYCYGNLLTSLDVSKNTALEILYCDNNPFVSFDVSKNLALKELRCFLCQLTSLDVSKNTELEMLDCFLNRLTSLDVSKNTKLEMLYCFSNQLTSLDILENTKLEVINCYGNQLTSLDVSGATALRELYCDNNQITSLDISKNTALYRLECYGNRLSTLNVTNMARENRGGYTLYCGEQTIDGITPQTLILTMRQDQEAYLYPNLTNLNVILVFE